jgi:ATP-dependent DNA helicase RecG
VKLASNETGGKTTQKTTQKSAQKTTQKILATLAVNPMFTRREIAKSLGDISENGVKYHLEKLKASGHIRRVGPDKGGHWEILK